MNVENILAVAHAIENHTVPGLALHMGFPYQLKKGGYLTSSSPDAKQMGETCDAVACIIGWTNSIFPTTDPKDKGDHLAAARTLGLLESDGCYGETANSLFYPPAGVVDDYDAVEPDHAVRVMRHLAATGEVDWSV